MSRDGTIEIERKREGERKRVKKSVCERERESGEEIE